MDKLNAFNESQNGFKSGRSTSMVILESVEDIIDTLDNKNVQ